MSIIDWRKHIKNDREDLCAWLLLELIANIDELSKKLDSGEINIEKINTSFIIEGVEVDFEQAANLMEESFYRLIADNAKKLVTEKINEIVSKMHCVEENLNEILSHTQDEVEKICNGEGKK